MGLHVLGVAESKSSSSHVSADRQPADALQVGRQKVPSSSLTQPLPALHPLAQAMRARPDARRVALRELLDPFAIFLTEIGEEPSKMRLENALREGSFEFPFGRLTVDSRGVVQTIALATPIADPTDVSGEARVLNFD